MGSNPTPSALYCRSQFINRLRAEKASVVGSVSMSIWTSTLALMQPHRESVRTADLRILAADIHEEGEQPHRGPFPSLFKNEASRMFGSGTASDK